ncbi:MAG: ABC transporter permease subunit [Patescibacteria group bacterium]
MSRIVTCILLGCLALTAFAGPALAAETFDVTVNSKPAGARVLIDGKDTGFTTPHTFHDMKPGTYKFTARYPRRYDANREEELYEGRPREITIDLYPSMVVIDFLKLIFPLLLRAALMTLLLTLIAETDGIIIGTLGGIARLANSRIVRFLSAFYVDFVRGTPLLVQIFMVYFGLPPILGLAAKFLSLGNGDPVHIAPFPAAILAMSINSGAYVTEIVRAGIQSIDRGQMEAARSLGMTKAQAMRYIILPQAIKRVIPPLGNEFIAMLKDSSLVSTIAMEELVRKGQIISTTYYRPTETWFAVAVVFLIMTLPFTRLVALLERRLKTSD